MKKISEFMGIFTGAVTISLTIFTIYFLRMLFSAGDNGSYTTYFNSIFLEVTTKNDGVDLTFGINQENWLPLLLTFVGSFLIIYILVLISKLYLKNKKLNKN